MKQIIRMKQLVEKIGLSRSTIYFLRKEEKFVPHIRLGARSVGYYEEDVIAWLKERALSEQKN